MIGSARSFRQVLISALSPIYRSLINGTSNTGIPALLIALLCVLYWVDIQTGAFNTPWAISCSVNPGLQNPHVNLIVSSAFFGGIDFEEAQKRTDAVIKYLRVSSESQKDQSGKERQKKPLNAEIERLEPSEVITIEDEWESARTMSRENIKKIYEIGKRDEDSTYCLMLEDVDRLSRAEPFEAATFFWLVKELGMIIYFDSSGYYDFSDPDQQLSVFFGLYQSRQEYNKIRTRTSKGQRKVKERGGVPSKSPYGYEKIGDTHVLQIFEEEAEVIREAVTKVLSHEMPVQTAHDQLGDEYGTDVIPGYSTLLRILRNELYTGKITHDGEIVGECPAIITDHEYEDLLTALGPRDNNQTEDELDPLLKSVLEEFEVDTVIQLFDIIKPRCPKCGGDVKKWGSTERWGHRIFRYKCESDECDFTGPLLSENTLQKWDRKLPILCPVCQTPMEDDEWSKSRTKIVAIEQECDECETEVTIDLPKELSDGLKRGLEFPDYALSMFDQDSEQDNSKVSSEGGSKNTDDSDEEQSEFDDFL